ncbi:uncharacterized protein LOC115886599 [Sitophilus oryzae]|uniref:Uncharacterized protein LOC115886599 n=1 Tax=Sitophilus oryzae TaxID=7048 RepID=A0A6J2YEX8_SITOR|nr:uncharacterized protein LOC115886599 [Sitophilus oryzae]
MSDIMPKKRNVEESLVEHFQCPVCYEFMDKMILNCPNGHSMCNLCISKLTRCPICKIKLAVTYRNINMEKASKTMKEWLAIHGNMDKSMSPAVVCAARRRQRRSLGSPLKREPSNDFLSKSLIQCPYSSCCYFTEQLLQLKIHIQNWHSSDTRQISNHTNHPKQANIKVSLYWDIASAYSMFTLSAPEVCFVVYIVRTPDSIHKSSHFINVLAISDQTCMYKFTCGHASKFCMFYQGRRQAQEGLEVNSSSVERVLRSGTAWFFTTLYISKVANLCS